MRSLAVHVYLLSLMFITNLCQAQEINSLAGFTYSPAQDRPDEFNCITSQFDGYTSHWNKSDWIWYNEGLFLLAQSSPQSERRWVETDIGNDLLLDELWIQDGFITRLANRKLPLLLAPSKENLVSTV